MNLQDQKPRSVYINCGSLDMREATEESVAAIKHVNCGNVMVTPKTRGFLSRFSINMGSIVDVPEDARLIMGDEVFGHGVFIHEDEPRPLVITGHVILEPDVTVEDIEHGWGALIVFGKLIYPEHLGGVINRKTRDIKGQLQSYRSSARLITGKHTLDEGYLSGLNDDSDLTVIGALYIPVAPDDLIERKIRTIDVKGKMTCHRENAQLLVSRFDARGGAPALTIVPEGYEYVAVPLHLDTHTIAHWSGRKIYCTERIIISDAVSAGVFDQAVASILSKEMIVCPAALASTLAQKCDTLSTRVIFYEGALWFVDKASTLHRSRFDYLEGRVTLFVTGALNIEPDVEPQALYERLAGVYNWGAISCATEQIGAIEARMVVNEGALSDSTPKKEEPEDKDKDDGTVTLNSGNFKL